MNDPTDKPTDESQSPDLDPTQRDAVARVDTQIGPYRLLERLGEGAMGEVWRAEQRAPIKRVVALKIIKRGMDTREVVTRFEIERQAMALMDHPWIARVYDAGETEGGRPYIAMEYVAGERLTDYCARNRLGIEDRLRLFQKVCQAIQHAHQKAVIHRDLKPSNILVMEVDGEPVPKVIDFGIAKATAQRLTDRSAATFVGQLIGTPLYMSPEQVEMSAAGVDTRADVYSLGVILYELLSGALPHDPEKLAHAAFDQVLKVLREEEPARPSTKVSTLGDRTAEVAAQRGLDAKKLSGKLRGDLDWITLKALEKDRKRRYESPKDVADDIDRYLHLEPIQARPPSVAYRLSRFTRRHRAPVFLATTVLVALIGVAIWQYVLLGIISTERDRAMANERLSIARERLDDDPTMAVAFALSSLELVDQEAARATLRRALLAGPIRDEWPHPGPKINPLSVDASLDGRLLAVACQVESQRPAIVVHDLEAGTHRFFEGPGNGFTYHLAFTSDASHVAALAMNGLHVWRVADGEHVLHAFDDDEIWSIVVFPLDDSRRLAVTVCDSAGVSEWYELDVFAAGVRPLGPSVGRENPQTQVHVPGIDGAGRWILEFDGTQVLRQRVEDLGTERAQVLGRHPVTVASVAIDRAGVTAASLDMAGNVWIWDLTPPVPRITRRLRLQADRNFAILKFDPHRPRLAAFGEFPKAELIDLEPHPPRAVADLPDRTHWTHQITFLPDGTMFTGRNGVFSGPVARWHRATPWLWGADLGDSLGQANSIIPSSDGSSIYTWMTGGAVVRIAVGESSASADAIDILGRTNAPALGMPHRLFVSDDERFLHTYRFGDRGLWRIDQTTREVREIDLFDREFLPIAMSPSGRMAAFSDYPDGAGEDRLVVVVDLETENEVAVLNRERTSGIGLRFVDEERLELKSGEHVFGVDLSQPDVVDTLWHEPGKRVNLLGSSPWIMLIDGPSERSIVDLYSGEIRASGIDVQPPYTDLDFHEGLGLLVLAGLSSGFKVFELDSGRSWLLPIEGNGAEVAIDPRGRWFICTAGLSGLTAYRLPPDPLFSELPIEEFLERARAVTNVRVVPDPSAKASMPGLEEGFRVTNTLEEAP